MTESKHLKARIRERMARTGERYMTARRHVVGAPGDGARSTTTAGGCAAACTPTPPRSPTSSAHHGADVSEAMVLGAGGGLGAGYILWEFEAHHQRARSCSASATSGSTRAAGRRRRSSASACRSSCTRPAAHGAAAAKLDAALAAGRPALATIDRQMLGHWHLPAALEGHGGYPVVVYGAAGDRIRIDDRNLAPLTVPRERLDAARARVGSYKHRLVIREPAAVGEERLREAARAGLADAVEHLSARSDSFGLPAWRKWARMLVDTRQRQGVAARVRGPDGARRRAALDLRGRRARRRGRRAPARPLRRLPRRGGGAARGARARRGGRRLPRARAALARARRARAAAARCPPFALLREQLAAVHESVIARGDAGAEDARRAAGQLWELRAALDAEPPFDRDAALELFARLERAARGDLRGGGRGAVATQDRATKLTRRPSANARRKSATEYGPSPVEVKDPEACIAGEQRMHVAGLRAVVIGRAERRARTRRSAGRPSASRARPAAPRAPRPRRRS